MIARKRTQPQGSDVLASLIHVRDEDGTTLSDEELIGHAFTLFVAGHETTSNALAATVLLLEQHPAVLADLSTSWTARCTAPRLRLRTWARCRCWKA